MLPSGDIKYWCEERVNTYRKSGKEWAICVQMAEWNGTGRWCIHAQEEQPTKEQIAIITSAFLRGCEFYHRHIVKPTFSMALEEDCNGLPVPKN